MRWFTVLSAVVIGLTGCRPEVPELGEVAGWEAEVDAALIARPFLDEMPEVIAKVPYEEISLERTRCYGDCPEYRVVFRKNGKAALILFPSDPKKREFFDGTVAVRTYVRLALMVETARRRATWSNYNAQWTDDYTATVRAGNRGNSWEVSDYGEVSPLEVWSLIQVLHALRQETAWKKKEMK